MYLFTFRVQDVLFMQWYDICSRTSFASKVDSHFHVSRFGMQVSKIRAVDGATPNDSIWAIWPDGQLF